jgi:hypothetical protein
MATVSRYLPIHEIAHHRPPTESNDSGLSTQGASFAHTFGKLWSSWLGLDRTPG